MEIKNKTYKVVTPNEGMWLYNESEKTISDKVYMPDGADVSIWKEITEAKKQKLEAQWQAESEVGDVTEERCRAWRICRHSWLNIRARCGGSSSMADCDGLRGRGGLVRWCSLRLADGGANTLVNWC